MTTANDKAEFQAESDRSEPQPDSTGFILSLATAPFLVALLAAEKVAELLQATGQASEEVFRGDRLPVLNFPPHPDSQDS